MSVSDILTNITVKNKHFLSICNISSMSQTSSQGISSPTHPFMRLIRHIRERLGAALWAWHRYSIQEWMVNLWSWTTTYWELIKALSFLVAQGILSGMGKSAKIGRGKECLIYLCAFFSCLYQSLISEGALGYVPAVIKHFSNIS